MKRITSPFFLFFALSAALVGCGKGDDAPRENSVRPYRAVAPSVEDARKEAARVLGEHGDLKRAVWDGEADGASWTATTLAQFKAHKADLESAQDVNDFCPRYWKASEVQRETCWLRIISAMARYESNFHPNATYLEASGRTSVGLLMMDPAHCANAPSVAALQEASANITCALQRMSLLISRNHRISGEGNVGASAYWSVLRAPYQFGELFLGRKPHIQEFTKSYLAFRNN